MATQHEYVTTEAPPDALDTNAPWNLPGSPALKKIFNLRFWDVDLCSAARYLVARAIAGERLRVFFVNAHCVNVSEKVPNYAKLLENAPFLFADGVGMAFAGRLCGAPLDHNVNGTDLFPEICEIAAQISLPIAFLGGSEGVAQACALKMQERFPGLRVVWTEHGFHSIKEEAALLDELNASGAKILFVAKGVPEQELWIGANSMQLAPPIVLGVGALFDFYSGTIKRAPKFLRSLRLEWMYRLWREPRRLFRRYVFGNPVFIARTVLRRLFCR